MPTATFTDLTRDEQAWVARQLEGAQLFLESYSLADAGQPLSLGGLDRAFAAWLAQGSTDTDDVNGAINVVGVRFGQFLVDEAGFRWVIASDEHGSDLAVLALPGRGDVFIYPASFVAKRWERRETGFLVPSFASVREQVAQVEAGWADAPRRRWWRFWG